MGTGPRWRLWFDLTAREPSGIWLCSKGFSKRARDLALGFKRAAFCLDEEASREFDEHQRGLLVRRSRTEFVRWMEWFRQRMTIGLND